MAKIELIIPKILYWEGGSKYTDDPDDSGGGTKYGITLSTLDYDVDGDNDINKEDIKKLELEDFKQIFKEHYWDRIQGDKINDQKVAEFIVDWFFNSGNIAIIKTQQIVGVKADGVFGNITLNAVNNSPDLFNDLYKARIDFVNAIIKRKPSQIKFLKGWLNRINSYV